MSVERSPSLSDDSVQSQRPEKAPALEKRRMLVVVNPYATTVSAHLKHLVIYALQSCYEVEVIDTEHQKHAIEISRSAAGDGFDLVVAFGGDGTVNEIANGLVGTDTPLAVLPGGSTNVFCRIIGVPNDVVEATEHLLSLNNNFKPRKIDMGMVNGRYFLFGSGVGVDADTVRRVDAHPKLKWRFSEYYYIYSLMVSYFVKYGKSAPIFRVRSEGRESQDAIAAIVQNTRPYAYFSNRRLELCEDVTDDSGTLSYITLPRAKRTGAPGITWRALTERPLARLRHAQHESGVEHLQVESILRDENGEPVPFPLHVDGDYIGDVTEANYGIHPRALTILA